MNHAALPSVKGQITIPLTIREKYHISKKTPVLIEDKGGGIITLQIMNMVDYDTIAYYENEKEFGLHFNKGIDPEILLKAIKKIDG